MQPQNTISHRLFVAALSHNESEARHRQSNNAMPAASTRGPRARALGAPESPGAVAQHLLLLSDAIEFQPAQA